jgi:hypothetical protein
MKKTSLYLQVIVVAAVVFGLDLLLASKSDGSMLIGLLFWAGIAQGIIAMTAAAELSQGKWIKEIKPYMQDYYPLLLIFPLAFLAYARHIPAYDWSQNQTSWLSPTFFIVRNFIALLIPFLIAHLYVQASKKESPRTGLFAVLYIVSFAISQFFMAFDQVMTFDYPWINTLFGPYFFVEALFAGIAFCAILAGLFTLKKHEHFKTPFADFTRMIQGFALLWAGLFYSQYLVIWYGNLPEEVAYIAKRLHLPYVDEMGIFIVFALFVIPFTVLISHKIKTIYPAVVILAVIVFSGLVVERLIYLVLVADLHFLSVLMPLIVLGIPFIYVMLSQYKGLTIEASE